MSWTARKSSTVGEHQDDHDHAERGQHERAARGGDAWSHPPFAGLGEEALGPEQQHRHQDRQRREGDQLRADVPGDQAQREPEQQAADDRAAGLSSPPSTAATKP